MDLALNNLQWLICHETKSNQTGVKYYFLSMSACHDWSLNSLTLRLQFSTLAIRPWECFLSTGKTLNSNQLYSA